MRPLAGLFRTAAIAATLFLAVPTLARAGTLELVNGLRTSGCPDAPAPGGPLLDSRALGVVAGEITKGRDLRAALEHAGLRTPRATVIRISGDVGEDRLRTTLRRSYCRNITEPDLTSIGIAQHGNDVVIVLAALVEPPDVGDSGAVARDVLEFVNEARATPRRCGRKRLGAVPPLALNAELEIAARWHASDMAARGVLTHTGSDASTPADRVRRAGYTWRAVGENVAAGQHSAKAVVEGWLASPRHCANIMGPAFAEMGVAYANNPSDPMGTYWSQVFASSPSR